MRGRLSGYCSRTTFAGRGQCRSASARVWRGGRTGVTLYEVAWLSAHGRVSLLAPLSFVLSQIESNFVVLPVTSSIARLAAELPAAFPGDPMDRMIAATALDQGVALITKDRAIAGRRL